MAEGKKTYYQVSFTGGQALAAVAVIIVALGVSFFLGAKAGFERSPEASAAAPRPTGPVTSAAAPAGAATTPAPPAAPEAAAGSGSGTEEAPVFEDREAGLPEAKTSGAPQAPSRTEIAGGTGAAAKKPSVAPPAVEKAKPAPEKRAEAAKPADSAANAPSERRTEHGYFVQILSTSSKAEASRWKEKLAARSWRTAAVTSVPSKKGTLWRVRVGPYPDAAQAKKAASKISAEFRQKAWVAPQ